MTTGPNVLYEFGPFRVDPEKQLLLRDGQPVPVTPKTFDTLLVLLRHHREVVTKDDLMQQLWPDSFVEEANLSQNIFMLRKALGDTPEDRRYIVTLPGKGYRFVAEVRTVTQHGDDALITSHTTTQTAVVVEDSLHPAITLALAPPPVSRRKPVLWIAALLLLAVAGLALYRYLRPPAPPQRGAVLIADFTNRTGDPVFDETLRQGLSVQLRQSPSLLLVSDDRVQRTLRLMGQPPDAVLTPELAYQVCQRLGSDAVVLDGSIALLGSQYVLGLRARNCISGEVIADQQVQAARKEDVLNALGGIASAMRTQLGESTTAVQQHSMPLAEATTPSLDALKAYSTGWRVNYSQGEEAAIPFFHQAIADDPQFALAYAALGLMYGVTGQSALAAENTAKAFQFRNRASERERFFITATYESWVTGNLEKAQQVCETWAQAYPSEIVPHTYLSGFIYPAFGKYDQAAQHARKVVELDPDFPVGYMNLGYADLALGKTDAAASVDHSALQRNLDAPYLSVLRFDIDFLNRDVAAIERLAAAARKLSSFEDVILNHQAFAAAHFGRLQQAVALQQLAADLARQAGQSERVATYLAGRAVWEGFFGDPADARAIAQQALAISADKEVQYGAAFALALAGDTARAESLADNLAQRFPQDTSVNFSYLPSVRAIAATNRRDPARALEILQAATPYELGTQRSWIHGNFGALYPIYARGLAYLASHQGAQAAAEFQKILDHPGVVITDPVGAMARLQLARAYALQGDTARAKSAYQDFLILWKDADPSLPIYQQAKAEYAKLP